MKKALFIAIVLAMSGCTYSIKMVHSEGQMSDLVEDTSTPTVSTSINTALNPNKPMEQKL